MRAEAGVANADLFLNSKESAAARKTTKAASGTSKTKIDSPALRSGFFQNGEKTKKNIPVDTAPTIWKMNRYVKPRREAAPASRQRVYPKTNSRGAAHTQSQM